MNQFDRVFQLHTLLQDKLGAPVVFDKERDGYRYDLTEGQYELPGRWFDARELQALVIIQRLVDSSDCKEIDVLDPIEVAPRSIQAEEYVSGRHVLPLGSAASANDARGIRPSAA
jgi:hypothetical protein